MHNTPAPIPSAPNALRHTLLLSCAVFLIPVLIGILFVLASHRLAPPVQAPSATSITQLTNRLHDGSASNIAQLAALRIDLRNAGVPTDEADLMLWAARVSEPESLFHVLPPIPEKRWNWHMAQDGLYALAVSVQLDAYERRDVGLYDLVGDDWVWTNALPWPDTHESPYVFGRHVVVRYIKNAARFALEVDTQGKIISIDRLSAGTLPDPVPVSPCPHCPEPPIARKSGVCFSSNPQDDALIGHAYHSLPGLRYAGKGDANTVFSGNGLLKFMAAEGRVTVADSLTQTILKTFDAWPHTTNTLVTGTLATRDGANFTVFLKTEFEGTPPIKREWSVAIDLYAGTVNRSVNADSLFAKPVRTVSLQAHSLDGQWQLAVDAANELTVSPFDAPERIVAHIPLAPLGLRTPILNLAFLEGGRHLVIRQDDDLWLLDFKAARAYGGLMARSASCSRTITPEFYRVPRETNPVEAAEPDAQLALSPDGYGLTDPFDSDMLSFLPDPNATAPSYLALRAERFVVNQAWGYAAALLEETARLQEYDTRAPRVNPLLLARCQLLSGQRQAAHATCRDTLRRFADWSDDTRMIRYQLQGLLFADE